MSRPLWTRRTAPESSAATTSRALAIAGFDAEVVRDELGTARLRVRVGNRHARRVATRRRDSDAPTLASAADDRSPKHPGLAVIRPIQAARSIRSVRRGDRACEPDRARRRVSRGHVGASGRNFRESTSSFGGLRTTCSPSSRPSVTSDKVVVTCPSFTSRRSRPSSWTTKAKVVAVLDA